MFPYAQVTGAARNVLLFNRLAAEAGLAASAHRLLGKPRQTDWPLHFEGIVELLARGIPRSETVEAVHLRRSLDSVTSMGLPVRAAVTPVNANGVPAEWVSAPSAERFENRSTTGERTVLYLHGGGYVSGSPRTHRALAGELAHAAGARLLLPAYRLAPEHPFPAALEDAWVAYWWLLSQGMSPGQIVAAGDSAGGGLALALLVALRDAGIPLPAGLVCISPWADLTLHGASVRANDGRDYLNAAAIRAVAALYLNGRDAHEALASPLFADLRGLPPTLIQAGTAELLLDDSKRLARRAAAAGVPVELELWENMVHVWHFLYPFEAKARHAIRRIGAFVRARVAAESAAGAEPVESTPWRA